MSSETESSLFTGLSENDEKALAPPPSQRTLAVDWGRKRTGLAVCDELGLTVRPLAVWPTGSRKSLVARTAALIAEERIVRCVVGLSYRLDGSPNQATPHILAFVEALRRATPVEVVTWNERLTSVAAEDWLREQGIPRRRWVERQDAVAAAILLQDFLASRTAAPLFAHER
ncbi:MAG: Holliday junction resolvase RuvX [Chloracidobacterium sp.]|nr:Holliday junction resolvase RuvX [Chloracidobacterium sp.]MDW8217898.1 Holliday junction resolvase RuvX [Acidobacteriota bacterium]